MSDALFKKKITRFYSTQGLDGASQKKLEEQNRREYYHAKYNAPEIKVTFGYDKVGKRKYVEKKTTSSNSIILYSDYINKLTLNKKRFDYKSVIGDPPK